MVLCAVKSQLDIAACGLWTLDGRSGRVAARLCHAESYRVLIRHLAGVVATIAAFEVVECNWKACRNVQYGIRQIAEHRRR
jgi:hypothetical protein